MNYLLCIIILDITVGTTKSSKIGHTYVFWLGTMITGHTMDITRTHPKTAHSLPLSFYGIHNCANQSSKSSEMKTHQFSISNRRFQIPMKKTTLNVLSRNFQWMQPRWMYCPGISGIPHIFLSSQNFFLLWIPRFPLCTSCTFAGDPFSQNFTTIITYWYISN